MIQSISIGDSSDDEIPQPMNFSALTKAILEGPSVKSDSPQVDVSHDRQYFSASSRLREQYRPRAGTPSRGILQISRQPPPQAEAGQEQASPRIVHLSATKHLSSQRRTTSSATNSESRSLHRRMSREDLVTPGAVLRPEPVPRSQGKSSLLLERAGSSGVVAQKDGENDVDEPLIDLEDRDDHGRTPFGDSTLRRSHTRTDVVPSSMRLKRVPVGSGTFLRGAPMRRGIRRRQSDEDGSINDELPQSDEKQSEPGRLHKNSHSTLAKRDIGVQDFAPRHQEAGQQSTARGRDAESELLASAMPTSLYARSRSPPSAKPYQSIADVPIPAEPVFKLPALRLQLGPQHDQENEPPPTFKRNKSHVSSMLSNVDKLSALADPKDAKLTINRAASSPPRQALAVRDLNTPRRAPPPPPKMTVLETATVAAGASSVKKSKKQARMTVNGKGFEVCGPFIGKGGSSRVYRVIAENGKIFALKRVKLESESPEAVRGFKGEIDLLKRLEKVDRVVRMYDWEINDEKQCLSVVSELHSQIIASFH